MKIEQREIRRHFVIWWILASVVAGVVGLLGLGEGVETYPIKDQASWPFLALGLAAGVISGVALAAIGYTAFRRDISWVWWCLGSFAVSAIGWTSVGAVSQAVAPGEMAISNAVIAAVKGIWLGGCIGTAQWLALGRKVSGTGWWILTSIIGWSILLTVGFPATTAGLIGHITTGIEVTAPGELVISGRDITILSQAGFAIFCGIAFGAQLGLMQWLVLQRSVGQARWWPLVSAAGWAMAWLIAGLVYRVLPTDMRFEFYGGLLFFGLFVGLGGAATGIPLVRLMRQPMVTIESPRVQPVVAWRVGIAIVVAIAGLASAVALATVSNEPEAPEVPEATGDCYSVRSDKDAIDVLSANPPSGTTVQTGAEVTVTVKCKYNLESHERADLHLSWTDNAESGLLASSEVSGSGQIVLEGILEVPNSQEIFLTLWLFPPEEVWTEARFTCAEPIVYTAEPIVYTIDKSSSTRNLQKNRSTVDKSVQRLFFGGQAN